MSIENKKFVLIDTRTKEKIAGFNNFDEVVDYIKDNIDKSFDILMTDKNIIMRSI